MKEAIRLTNRTAMGLRKSAQKVRTAYFVAEIVISVMLGAAGIVLGFLWLPAVPLMIVLIALIDGALMTASRSRYLSLLGQAICTEAAAREISAAGKERKRLEQKEKDLRRIKEDVKEVQTAKKPGAQPFFEEKDAQEEQEDDDLLPEKEVKTQEDAPRRRRRQNPLTLIRSEQAK